jgi:ribosomal protein S12 methylthiotransferase accessory factor YcaO
LLIFGDSFDPPSILDGLGASSLAASVPFISGRVVDTTFGITAAFVEVARDANCPHGLFASSSAFDEDPNRAIERAIFEAIERYALGAYGIHSSRIRRASVLDPRIWQYRANRFSDFEYGPEVLAIPAMPDDLGQQLLIPIGDVFAPYPAKEGSSGLLSSSNGTAFHRSRTQAMAAAARELIERHAIMHLWFMDRKFVRRIEFGQGIRECHAYGALKDIDYEILVLEISPFAKVHVVFALAIQKSGFYPVMVCAAAAGPDQASTAKSALTELFQTAAALTFQTERFNRWRVAGRPVTHLDHNMFFYADPNNRHFSIQVMESLKSRAEERLNSEDFDGETVPSLHYVDLSHPRWENEAAVVRALSDKLCPLVIGDKYGPRRLLCSPSRILLPHPFP